MMTTAKFLIIKKEINYTQMIRSMRPFCTRGKEISKMHTKREKKNAPENTLCETIFFMERNTMYRVYIHLRI